MSLISVFFFFFLFSKQQISSSDLIQTAIRFVFRTLGSRFTMESRKCECVYGSVLQPMNPGCLVSLIFFNLACESRRAIFIGTSWSKACAFLLIYLRRLLLNNLSRERIAVSILRTATKESQDPENLIISMKMQSFRFIFQKRD